MAGDLVDAGDWRLDVTPMQGTAKGVVLICHGLNLNSDKMSGLQSLFPEHHVFNLRLSGHHKDFSAFKKVSRNQWLKEWEMAYFQAESQARELKLPLYYVGFSLGGVLALDWMNSTGTNKTFDHSFLFAPALALTRISRLALPLVFYGPKGWWLPSKSEPEYKNFPRTTFAAYRALFESVAAIKNPNSHLIDQPTTVVMDPNDTLVDYSAIQAYVSQHRLSRWKFLTVDSDQGSLKRHHHHLIIDEKCLGFHQWETIRNAVNAAIGT